MSRIVNSRITGGFWEERQRKIAGNVLYEQYAILNGKRQGLKEEQYSYGIENFRIAAGESAGEYHGFVYSDSEVGKWLEAVAYSLRSYPDPELESMADDLIALMERAQMPDGYLNTYFQVLRPCDRLKYFAFSCELYNIGHLMEAAAAYYETTGKRRFLDMMCRTADLLCRTVSLAEFAHVYDGHAEIELGLYRIYQATGNRAYLELAYHFIKERGRQPCFFLTEELLGDNDTGANDKWFGPDHHQAHKPVWQQDTAEGHAVKVTYLYAAVADMVREGLDKDGSLETAMRKVWSNIVGKRMYLTGAIGSQGYAERFTVDYDLPADRGYLETCASVGLCFFASRLSRMYHDTKYADVMEYAIYNGVLAGWSLSGNEYFYTNTLHYKRGVTDYREDCKHLETIRQKWFRCACCPSNILRLYARIQDYFLYIEEKTVFCDLYGTGRWEMELSGNRFEFAMETDYPYEGKIAIKVRVQGKPLAFCLALRVPGWCKNYRILLDGKEVSAAKKEKGGYFLIDQVWEKEETVELCLDMPVRYVFPHPRIWDCAGKAALARGPLIYCLESADHGDDLAGLTFVAGETFLCEKGTGVLSDIPVLVGKGVRSCHAIETDSLYMDTQGTDQVCEIRAIPYFAWNNRGRSDMDVWLPYRSSGLENLS